MKLTRWVVLMPALGLLSSMAVSAYAQPDPAKIEAEKLTQLEREIAAGP